MATTPIVFFGGFFGIQFCPPIIHLSNINSSAPVICLHPISSSFHLTIYLFPASKLTSCSSFCFWWPSHFSSWLSAPTSKPAGIITVVPDHRLLFFVAECGKAALCRNNPQDRSSHTSALWPVLFTASRQPLIACKLDLAYIQSPALTLWESLFVFMAQRIVSQGTFLSLIMLLICAKNQSLV